ncbi:PadR family transcriptional regulator [Methylovirgula sp. HY1]|uniref:PadR family transcriptional regulator n=1 Tax=Methylovirgula sp. HY1 TaxID=2822761 RepID=UPI001C5A92C9|nr:PadR family transcriptional regulator [Methylovirgula sp. HY1]QXX75664.1 Transcriptional regulator YqjI [Methylovirgula sp. HY1]
MHSHNTGYGAPGQGMRGRGHPFRREGGRGGRLFEQGDLRWVILKLVAERPAHGYELIKAIEDRLGGAYAPSPGTIYPTLTLLEELGYVAITETDGPRKLYAVTEAGRAALAEEKQTVDAIFAKMADIEARYGGGPPPQILRAYENLKTALKLRVGRGSLTVAEVARVAELLDEAAKAVENT